MPTHHLARLLSRAAIPPCTLRPAIGPGARLLLVALVLVAAGFARDDYFPPPEAAGGWRRGAPAALGADAVRLREVLDWHRAQPYAAELGASLLVVYRGHLVVEDYVTGSRGGPQPWTAATCNDLKSSTKSVFGTAAGVFLEEFKDRVTLDSHLVGSSRATSLIPQIWDQPLTDPRKAAIRVRHVLSMTSGHPGPEPWWGPLSGRRHTPGYTGAFQVAEYCFGWWHLERTPSQRQLRFDPGTDFTYSNFGLEQFALAMRNLSGERVGPYLYDRVLGRIGLPRGVRDHAYVDVPYRRAAGLNFSPEPGWAVGGATGGNAYEADGEPSPYGSNTIVGSTLRLTARDFARLGYLWLRRGRWGNAQLVPADWLDFATRRHVRADGSTPKEYGLTFWIYDQVEGVPADTFATHGDRFNDSYVVRSRDLVVVRQGNLNLPDRAAVRQGLIRRLVAAFPPPPVPLAAPR